MNIREFLDQAREGNLSTKEISSYINIITRHLDVRGLRTLEKDVSQYIRHQEESLTAAEVESCFTILTLIKNIISEIEGKIIKSHLTRPRKYLSKPMEKNGPGKSSEEQTKNDRERDKIKMSVAKSYLKPFPDYLLHKRKELLAGEIKNEFKTEYGKGIRLLIEALIDSNPTLLTIENRKRKAIYKALKEYLNRAIGSYQSIFCFKYIPEKHKKDFDSINTRLQFIIENLTR